MRHIVAIACVVASGCEAPEIDESVEPLIGASPDLRHTNVVALNVIGGGCSATLISRRVVLTAGHCAEPYGGRVTAPAGTALILVLAFGARLIRRRARG